MFKAEKCTKSFEAVAYDSGKMYKYIFSFFIRNKSVTFFGIKPFYCSLLHKTFLLTHCSSLPQGLIYFFILAQFSMFVNEFHSPGAWFYRYRFAIIICLLFYSFPFIINACSYQHTAAYDHQGSPKYHITVIPRCR